MWIPARRIKACKLQALGARCFCSPSGRRPPVWGRFVGAKEARGEYLLFLDGDMQLQPGFAEKGADGHRRQAGYDGVCGIREDVYLRGGEVVCRNDNYFGCTQERLALEFGGALMITRDALDACGGWATDTIACEEAELYARLGDRLPHRGNPRSDDPAHGCGARSRSPLSTVFSARRLGEGQALACAMKVRPGRAPISATSGKKFTFTRWIGWRSLLALCARFRRLG